MRSADDVRIAEQAIETLKRLHGTNTGAAERELAGLVQKVHRTKGYEQAELFIAVQCVRKAIAENENGTALNATWDAAIAAAEVWRKRLLGEPSPISK
jgi:hypothetical protein